MAQLTRTEALKIVDAAYPDQPIVVNVGAAIREMVAAVGYKPNHLHVLDSMGLPPAIGLGLSLGLAESRFSKVVTIEGDGGLLMGFSVLSTIGMLAPEKMVLVILDNGTYGSTGHQPTAAASTDFSGVARACGMQARDVESADALRQALDEAKGIDAPMLIRARIGLQGQKTPYFLEDPVVLAETFRRFLRGAATGG
ncbi:MAG: phosphonopyruvate decarboxylase [Chloroflexi bacterium]|nr:phosphonopyruvate decarboxylase [Chloroflexota bacterium]